MRSLTGRRLRVAGIVLAASLALAGCAGGTADPGTGVTEGEVDPNGVIHLPFTLATFNLNFDPANPTPPNPNRSPVIMIYDTLLRPTGEGGALEPGLAKAVEFVDDSTIHIVLNEGITFTDGEVFDAEAVKTGIEYLVASESTVLAPERKAIESIDIDGDLELTLHLNRPIAGEVIQLFAWSDFLIPSPKALADGVDLATTPVGAGPFMLESHQPGERLTLVKNPDYFQVDSIKLAGVEWINMEATEAQVNALSSGVVDVSEGLSYGYASQLQNTSLHVELSPSQNEFLWGQMCKSRAPFDDVRVRQALNFAIDREAVSNVIYGGQAAPVSALFGPTHPLYDESLEGYYDYDVEKAQALLEEAGYGDGLDFDMFVFAGMDRTLEVIQAQWKEAGINVTLKPLTNVLEFAPNADGAPIAIYQQGVLGIQRVVRVLSPGSFFNVCAWDDPELNAAVEKQQGTEPGSAENFAATAEVQRIVTEQALGVFVTTTVESTVWNDERVGGVSFMPNKVGAPTLNFYEAYVKKTD